MHKTLVNTNTSVPEGWPQVGGAQVAASLFLDCVRENVGMEQNVGYLSLLRKSD